MYRWAQLAWHAEKQSQQWQWQWQGRAGQQVPGNSGVLGAHHHDTAPHCTTLHHTEPHCTLTTMAPKKKEVTGDLMISTAEYKKTRDSLRDPEMKLRPRQFAVLVPKLPSHSKAGAMMPGPPKQPRPHSASGEAAANDNDASIAYTYTQVIASLHNLQAGLIHVQHGITDLLSNYRKHCASVLGDEEAEIPPFNDVAAVAASVMEAGRTAADDAKQALAPVDKAIDAGKSKKRKREKKEKDPNAPKKPLTAAFLYHQNARPIVKADLEAALPPGAAMEKNAVQVEVNKRWAELPNENKEQWKAQYRKNMEEYKINLAEYLAKKGIKDAASLVEEEDDEDDDDAEIEAGALESDMSDEDDEASAAKKKSSRSTRNTTETDGDKENAAAAAAAAAATLEKAGKEKKRDRSKRKGEVA
ncbi:hmg box [Pyrenophora seminiperda CCB06]|uniref:Hmg box n=1 Tax=Pyrenophora seminiperda CCB06 TaxID=1302712 RepID=A0A3M7MH43_9PLEO|nr:hmg box [Pyrenophora seminiperda CCB06]